MNCPRKIDGKNIEGIREEPLRTMPIYEYYCPRNNKIYSFYAKTHSQAEAIPKCPDNARYRLEKIVSRFSVTGRKGEAGNSESEFGGDPDDPRMEAAIAEMEREMSGMDEENPDPRQMGSLMRKMAGLSGEDLPPSMEEMVRRMEAGEDPEKLEEEFGDLLEEDLADGNFDDEGATASSRSRGRGKTLPPSRDPTLYDFEDYI